MSELKAHMIEVKEAKGKLEMELQQAIVSVVSEFYRKYEFNPSDIHVEMVETETLGHPMKDHLVGRVKVLFDLE